MGNRHRGRKSESRAPWPECFDLRCPGWYDDDQTVAAIAELVEVLPDLLRESANLFDLDLPGPRALHRVQHVLSIYPDVMVSDKPLPDAKVVDRGFIQEVFDEETTFGAGP